MGKVRAKGIFRIYPLNMAAVSKLDERKLLDVMYEEATRRSAL